MNFPVNQNDSEQHTHTHITVYNGWAGIHGYVHPDTYWVRKNPGWESLNGKCCDKKCPMLECICGKYIGGKYPGGKYPAGKLSYHHYHNGFVMLRSSLNAWDMV